MSDFTKIISSLTEKKPTFINKIRRKKIPEYLIINALGYMRFTVINKLLLYLYLDSNPDYQHQYSVPAVPAIVSEKDSYLCTTFSLFNGNNSIRAQNTCPMSVV